MDELERVKELGQYLKQLRKNKNMTLKQLAEATNLTIGYLSNIENGRRGIPSPDILRRLSRPLGQYPLNLMIKAGHIEGVPDYSQVTHYSEIFEKYNLKIESNNIIDVITLIQMHLDRIPLQGVEAKDRLSDFRKGLDSFMALKRISIQNLRDLIYDKNSKELVPLFTTVEEAAVINHSLTVLSNVCALEQERDTLEEKVEELFERSTNLSLRATHYNGHVITDQDRKLISSYLDALFTDRQ